MKRFEEFVENGAVKKQMPNKERALSLIEESQKKRIFLDISLKSIPPEKMNPNFVVDYCYDIIMELIRAKMLINGLNSGSSHEAEVSYMGKMGFSENEVRFMDEVRYYRNGTKYYGTMLSEDYSQKVFKFMNIIYPRLKELTK